MSLCLHWKLYKIYAYLLILLLVLKNHNFLKCPIQHKIWIFQRQKSKQTNRHFDDMNLHLHQNYFWWNDHSSYSDILQRRFRRRFPLLLMCIPKENFILMQRNYSIHTSTNIFFANVNSKACKTYISVVQILLRVETIYSTSWELRLETSNDIR